MATLSELATRVGISNEYGARLEWDKQDDWQQQANGWRVTLRYSKRRMSVDFWQGQRCQGEPTAENVLECLLSDANGYESARDFEDFAAEYGYDTDSRKAERIYQQCGNIAKRLRKLLGDDFQAFIDAER